jgi:hypothetical protein
VRLFQAQQRLLQHLLRRVGEQNLRIIRAETSTTSYTTTTIQLLKS